MVNTLRVLPINLEYVLDILTILVNNGLIYRRMPYTSTAHS
jgi:hypothetical protein